MSDVRFANAVLNALNANGISVPNATASAIAESIIADYGNPRFAALTDVLYAQTDTREVEKSIIAIYEGIMTLTLYPGDPVRIFLSSLAAMIAQKNAVDDYTSKQNLIRYAVGAYLEHLGAFLDVYRHDAEPAKTVLRFSLTAERAIATVVPKGTRATADGSIFFETDSLLLISAGQTEGDIAATCLTYGKAGTGIAEGEIKAMVDTVAFVSDVENIKTTTGGSDIEDDESLRFRIRLAPGQFSTAGSELSYVFYSLKAHGNIGDVSVVSPLPGIVNVFVMLHGGGIPDPDGAEIMAVRHILGMNPEYFDDNPDNLPSTQHRPLNDMVVVLPIRHEPVDYALKWFITNEQAVFQTEIANRIKDAVAEYETWQTERARRDIVPDKLIQLCRAAGAKRIELYGLHFMRIDSSSVANFIENPDRVEFGGVESE